MRGSTTVLNQALGACSAQHAAHITTMAADAPGTAKFGEITTILQAGMLGMLAKVPYIYQQLQLP